MRINKLLVSFCLFFLTTPLFAQTIPEVQGRVNDFAGVISPEYRNKIDSLIAQLERTTGAEIAVTTIESIAPYDEKEYARMLFDKWKPGKKGKDNGVLVLVAIRQRLWRIETGYGLESVLPDGRCGKIGREYMAPYFKEGNFSQGLYYGVAQLAQAIAVEYNVRLDLKGAFPEEHENNSFPAFGIFILAIYAVFAFTRYIHWLLLTPEERAREHLFRPYIRGGYYGGSYGGGFGGGGFGGFGGGSGGGGGASGRF
jgi:uncharacterized protein